MEALKVATLIEALALVGQIYRNKDGSQPAEAVKKILQQLDGAAEMTLAEWVDAKQSKPRAAAKKPKPKAVPKQSKPKAAAKKPAKSKPERLTPDDALNRLQHAETQAALRSTVASLELSTDEWKTLAKRLTGRVAKNGKVAREDIETYLSDQLLLDERVASVKRLFS